MAGVLALTETKVGLQNHDLGVFFAELGGGGSVSKPDIHAGLVAPIHPVFHDEDFFAEERGDFDLGV